MDMIDILGGLLGGKSKGDGSGAEILKDILKRTTQRDPAPQSAPPAEQRPGSRMPRPPASGNASRTASRPGAQTTAADAIDRQARELEDLLAVAEDRNQRKPAGQSAPPPRPTAPVQRPAPPSAPSSTQPRTAPGRSPAPPAPVNNQDDQALVLVRAMINAAKADGQITTDEQQRIIQQLGESSPAAIEFLRAEFAKPVDVREFAWSVPPGMEQQVYATSLIAIEVDSDRETSYLRELAHGLRLAPEVVEQLDQRYGGRRRW